MPRIGHYFAVASALVVLLTLIMTGFSLHSWALRSLIEMVESQNESVAHPLSNSVWSEYGDYLTKAADMEAADLRAAQETKGIDELLRLLSRDVSILKIKIYSPEGLTVYSSEMEQIGQIKNTNLDHFDSALKGRAKSSFSSGEDFSAYSGELFDRDVVETYVSMTTVQNDLVGVFEIYSDVTSIKARLDRQILILTVALFGILRRAMAPLDLAGERARLINPGTSGVRLAKKGMPGEVLPLIETINSALERLDRALDAHRRFIGDAAHELLTPLAVLRANIDTLDDKATAKTLRKDAETMSAIVTQLLELDELESIEVDKWEPLDVSEASREVVAQMAPFAYRDGKEISLDCPEKSVVLNCCPKAFARALRNLVENAIVHTPKGTKVEVSVAKNGRISVRDHGPGVPPQDRASIFQRFWRGQSRQNRPGVGLGLSIVKRFAEMSGGTIEVADAEGGGALFVLDLNGALAKNA
jgi:signal transduction histidine kinase